jgi:hypothetical protein
MSKEGGGRREAGLLLVRFFRIVWSLL